MRFINTKEFLVFHDLFIVCKKMSVKCNHNLNLYKNSRTRTLASFKIFKTCEAYVESF